MKKTEGPQKREMQKIVTGVRRYLELRLERESIERLNEIIRELRIVLQQVMTDSFLSLPLDKAREFRVSLGNELSGLCKEMNGRSKIPEDADHHHYCVREVMACFEWAEQIKEEVPQDTLTQRVLMVDIPILRPFNYGFKGGHVIHPRKK